MHRPTPEEIAAAAAEATAVPQPSDEEIAARIAGDPDEAPIGTGFGKLVIPVRAIRERLGFSETEFARILRVRVETLRDWEQKRTTPEGPARALLTVIDREPEAVRRALALDPAA